MSSSKPKKVSHERGTSKSFSQHKHKSSRDSAIGSTSASDRASVGTAVHQDAPLKDSELEDQRYNLRVVQEALNAAYDRIKKLEASHTSLNDSLAQSHKENRALKKEKSGLLRENEDLLGAIDDLNKKLRREASPRAMAATSASASSKTERPSAALRKPDSPKQLQYDNPTSPHSQSYQYDHQPQQQRPVSNHGDRRSSLYERHNLPSAPEPPTNPHPNPFMPRTTPVITYSPTTSYPAVSYSPSTVSYTTSPPYAITPSHISSNGSPQRRQFDDGKYHLQPL